MAARCQVSLEFERYRFPGFPVPSGETPFSYLERLCHDGVRQRYHPMTPRVLKQMAHELEVIERTGLAEFFLICWDLMRFSRERGIPAQGRGSAGDSIVAYALGITRVDPIRHELLFERFINEGRTTYPDVDIDFASSRREEVIAYVYERYGAAHTGMVCNVVTYRARSAVREVGTALGFPRPLVDRVAKALETYDSVMVRRDLEADGGFAEFFAAPAEGDPGIRRLLDEMGELRRLAPVADLRPGPTDDEGGPGDTPASERRILATSLGGIELDPLPPRRRGSTLGLSPWDRWLELCARIDGRPRHLSIHVGGMLVTRAPLVDIAPLEHATMPGRVVVQFDKRDVETMKLIKLDLLGLRMLSAIDDALRDIRADCAVCLDLDRLPEDIEEVFRMICAADTVGVFQIESRAQMQTLPKSRPETLDDLVVEVAIIRPGPIQGDAVHPYLRRRQGLEPVTYLHPSLEPILAETLGVILYQEQVMKVAIDVAGFSAADSDGFRRAMGTWRSTREMEKLHAASWRAAWRTSGLTLEQAEELFGKVAGFASFGFNKSHAAAFARTAYESAFLKLFYPGPVRDRPHQRPAHGLLPGRGARQRRQAPRRARCCRWTSTPAASAPRPSGSACRARRCRPRPASSGGPRSVGLAGRRRAGHGGPRSLRGPLGARLRHPPGPAPRQGHRRGGRGGARRRAGPWRPLPLAGRPRGPHGAAGGASWSGSSAAGALDSLGQPRREALWQLREVVGRSPGTEQRSRRRSRAGRRVGRWISTCRPPRHRRCRRRRSWSGSATPTPSSRSTRAARSWSCTGRRSRRSARCRWLRSPGGGPDGWPSAGSSSRDSTP